MMLNSVIGIRSEESIIVIDANASLRFALHDNHNYTVRRGELCNKFFAIF